MYVVDISVCLFIWFSVWSAYGQGHSNFLADSHCHTSYHGLLIFTEFGNKKK